MSSLKDIFDYYKEKQQKEKTAYTICKNCKKEKNNIPQSGISEGLCNPCYRKLLWKPKLIKCLRCERRMPNHAKGYCNGCYNSTFYIENVKVHNAKRLYNIGLELYKKLVEKCNICSFDKIVELHHLDHNRKNNAENNLVGLCPNHHKMLHSRKYQKEIFEILKSKGFIVPENRYKTDGFIKVNRNAKSFNHLQKISALKISPY